MRCRQIVEELYTSDRGEYLCEVCFDEDLEDVFDADELGLDPEEPYDA
jgi:hypothetical protein